MRTSSVAKRYAQALFQAALDKGQLEIVESDFNLVINEYRNEADFKKFIDSPVISNENKITVITRVFQDRVSDVLMNFLLLLIQKNRENYLVEIHYHFKELLDDYRGIVRGTVYSAVPLTDEQLSELQRLLNKRTGKEVVLVQKIDENLLGGFIVQIKDVVIDSSIRSQLNRLKEQLAGSM